MDHSWGWIKIDPGGIIVPRIHQHGVWADEVRSIQSTSVLEHVGTLARGRVHLRIIRSKQTYGVQIRSEDR